MTNLSKILELFTFSPGDVEVEFFGKLTRTEYLNLQRFCPVTIDPYRPSVDHYRILFEALAARGRDEHMLSGLLGFLEALEGRTEVTVNFKARRST